MASIADAEAGAKVMLLDKGKRLGQKLAISGGGRCNVTNRMPVGELIKHLPGNGKFLYSALSSYDNESIIQYFEELGIPVKEEDRGRMFPVSDSAKTVVNALLDELTRLEVTMKTSTRVQRVLHNDESVQGVLLENGEEIEAKKVILASGGKSVPKTGSTGDGYIWAKECGHTITELYPTEVPLTSDEAFIKKKSLQGLSLGDVALTAWTPKNKAIKTYNAEYLNMTIDLFPDDNEQDVMNRLLEVSKKEPNKSLRNVWKSLVPERDLLFLLGQIDLDEKMTYHQLPKQKLRELTKLLKAFPVKINGTLSIEKAFITGGGVSLKEVNPKTMASKKMNGLYFCGEILDIHGYTGGYNITAAFVTGHTAGTDAAKHALVL